MNLNKLYNESISFKTYVDRYCKEHNERKVQAFNDIVVKQYAFYLKMEGKKNGKNNNNKKQ